MDADTLLNRTQRLLADAERGRMLLARETGDMIVCGLLAPGIVGLLGRAIDLLTDSEKLYESDDDERDPARPTDDLSILDDIAALFSSTVAAQEIGDLAFLSRRMLTSCRDKLQSFMAEGDEFQKATHCEVGLRRLARGMAAMEYAICTFEGQTLPEQKGAHLEEALEVRRLYWELRRIILGASDPADIDLPPRLRNFSDVIGALRSRPVFSQVRIEDRIHMFRLSERIAEWLEADDRDFEQGRLLWKDMRVFAELLTEINNRQELRAHDRSLIKWAWQNIGEALDDDTPPQRVMVDRLRTLLGLDETLDTLILETEPRPAGEWKILLWGLCTSLSADSDDLDREIFLHPDEPEGR